MCSGSFSFLVWCERCWGCAGDEYILFFAENNVWFWLMRVECVIGWNKMNSWIPAFILRYLLFLSDWFVIRGYTG